VNLIDLIVKYCRIIKYRKPFVHPNGMKFESYRDFLNFINRASPYGKTDFIKYLKRNSIRGEIHFYKYPMEILVKVDGFSINRIKRKFEANRMMTVLIKYQKLKWYEGWFPRYRIYDYSEGGI
jgi:hypothetical protein